MSLLFQERHLPMIREGTKTATRRIWDEDYPRPNVGSVRGAVTSLFTPTEDIDCWIRITDHRRELLQLIGHDDLQKEGGYSIHEFREIWSDLYGEWDQKQVVDVVEFEYVGRERPPSDSQTVIADGGRSSIHCYDCERPFDRRRIGFYDVPVPNDEGLGYDMVPVPLCRDCQLRRYGVECHHCGVYHADAEAVFECGRDHHRVLADGGFAELGELHLASVSDMGGKAVLTIVGTDDTARVNIPEDKALAFRDTAREAVLVYDPDELAPADDEVLIGDGGTDEALLEDLRSVFVELDGLQERADGLAAEHLEVAQRHVDGAKEATERDLEADDQELVTDGGTPRADEHVRTCESFSRMERHVDQLSRRQR